MNFLSLVQTAYREAKLPGAVPTGVDGLSGRAADVVNWVREAWNDVQRERQWKWMYVPFTLDTTAANQFYQWPQAKDSQGVALTRFRQWDIRWQQPPFIYKVADGRAYEGELIVESDWARFRNTYMRGTHTAAPPTTIAVDDLDQLWLGPTPDAVYRISGYIWNGNQTLISNGNTPECHADYHMVIVYRALVKYGYNVVAQDVLARCEAEGAPIFEDMVRHQAWGRSRLGISGSLA